MQLIMHQVHYKKKKSLQNAASTINIASTFYRRLRTGEAYKHFYDDDIELLLIQAPLYRMAPRRQDNINQSVTPIYFMLCAFIPCCLLLMELHDRYNTEEF